MQASVDASINEAGYVRYGALLSLQKKNDWSRVWHMTNAQIMKKHLEAKVIQPLLDRGFTGKYPHFRKEDDDCIELITFQTNKYGGSFTVEVSAVFPNRDNKNFVMYEGLIADRLNVWNTNERYRLKGMYDGWFYYHDLYAKRIMGLGKNFLSVSEKQKENFVAPKGYKLVQEFQEDTAKMICDEVNIQLKKAFRWLEKLKKRKR